MMKIGALILKVQTLQLKQIKRDLDRILINLKVYWNYNYNCVHNILI
jgi:hypothetical protein